MLWLRCVHKYPVTYKSFYMLIHQCRARCLRVFRFPRGNNRGARENGPVHTAYFCHTRTQSTSTFIVEALTPSKSPYFQLRPSWLPMIR